MGEVMFRWIFLTPYYEKKARLFMGASVRRGGAVLHAVQQSRRRGEVNSIQTTIYTLLMPVEVALALVRMVRGPSPLVCR